MIYSPGMSPSWSLWIGSLRSLAVSTSNDDDNRTMLNRLDSFCADTSWHYFPEPDSSNIPLTWFDQLSHAPEIFPTKHSLWGIAGVSGKGLESITKCVWPKLALIYQPSRMEHALPGRSRAPPETHISNCALFWSFHYRRRLDGPRGFLHMVYYLFRFESFACRLYHFPNHYWAKLELKAQDGSLCRSGQLKKNNTYFHADRHCL